MNFNAKTCAADAVRSACVVVAVSEPRRLSPAARQLDKAGRGQLSALLKRGDIATGCGKTTLIHTPQGNIQAERILVVGCGKERKLSVQNFGKIVAAAARNLQSGSGSNDLAKVLY